MTPRTDVPPDPAPSADPGAPAPELAEVGFYPTPWTGFDRGLVVLAMGLPYWLVPAEGGCRLLVESARRGEVLEQLAAYEGECAAWPPPPPAPGRTPGARRPSLTPFLWALAVIGCFAVQQSPGGKAWEERGVLDPAAVFSRGEWWRIGTALFLHADVGHLASNLVAGLFVFSLVLSAFGGRRGWALLALAALAGNLADAGLHDPGPFRSLGASTAVFGGVGLLSGGALRAALSAAGPGRLRGAVAPLAAGLALLGLYGTGGVRTDLAAHAAGFAAGLAAGFAAGRADRRMGLKGREGPADSSLP